jgi:predicted alpha/beta-hydrolase family hydrolase
MEALSPMLELETPRGPARVHLHSAPDAWAALILGHGAGGGVGAPDLVAAAEAARQASVSVALVEQPYRVAGRRSSPPAPQLDEAWISVLEQLRGTELGALPSFVGGRSAGARVACRTAATTGAAGVICLAFPLRPPGRASAPSRLPELDAVSVPTLVVQGERDPFGIPPASGSRSVVLVPGDHSLRAASAVQDAVRRWLDGLGAPG